MERMLFYIASGKVKVTVKDFHIVVAQERSYTRLLLSSQPFELYLSKYTMGHGI